MRRPSGWFSRLAAVLIALAAGGGWPTEAEPRGGHGDWPDAVGRGATRYSPLDQITSANVDNLAVAWRWPTADRALQLSNPVWVAGRNEEMPLLVNGTLYTITGLGLVAALDPGTGKTRWVYDPESYKAGRPNNVGFVQRGLAYWTDGKDERLFAGTADAYLLSIDPTTGRPDPAFGVEGKVDLTTDVAGATRAVNFTGRRPLVAGNLVVTGNSIADGPGTQQMPVGDVQAYDVRSGRKAWAFHPVPRKGEFGYNTWLNESAEVNGSANVWGGMTYDPGLDYVYFVTSSADNNSYGGRRPGDNLFTDSLVCVEAKTGRRIWHFQAVHHDIWDYDFPAPPILAPLRVDGRTVDAVIQVSKQAFTYAFDRKTGRPVWPIEERPVAKGSAEGEWYSPTQPFPTKPAPFDLQGSTADNLIDYTPALKAQALQRLQNFDHGPLFTPPTEKGTLVLPGWQGGANWGGASFDPETGILYVPSVMNPTVRWPRLGRQPDASLLSIDGIPIFKPPYTRITAIDMNKGEHLWMAPLGNGPLRHPLLKDLSLKTPLGDAIDRATVLVTKTLLFVGASRVGLNGLPQRPAWEKFGDPDADRKLLYVLDKRSGTVRREIQLDGFSAAAPMTYMHGAKQYIVMAVGARENSELVALSLGPSRVN